jgi:MSHA biogenesis protein MshQ
MPYELLPPDKHFTNVPDNTSNHTLVSGTQLLEGDNFYKKSSKSDSLKVTVSDLNENSTARLYINDSVVWENVKINKEGDPEDLIIYINGALQISGDETEINGIIYATGSIAISGKAKISGAVSSQSNISMSDDVELEYDDESIEEADFTGMCLPELEFELLADFHFDKCRYTGAVGEVIDQTGNFSGSAHSGVNTNTIGQINRFAELTNSNHHIETSIPLPEEFSISTWFKKPRSTSGSRYFVLGGMNGGGDLMYIDREDEWRWGVRNLSGATSGSYSFERLDNEWHQLTLVYDDDETTLYIDGELVDTIDRSVSGTLKYIGTSNDSINDSGNERGFRAPLDEFIVFAGELAEDDIEAIYENQSKKLNYDKSNRDPVSCSPQTLLGLYRFEQNSLQSQVDDSSDYDHHGTNIDGQVIAQGKYCRGFDSNGANSSDITKHAFSSNLNLVDDIGVKGTISFWFNSNTQWNKGGYKNRGERTLFDATRDRGIANRNKYFTLGITKSGRLRFSFEDAKDKDFSIVEPDVAIRNANKWYYVTATWDFPSQQFGLYVDGKSRLQRKKRTSNKIKKLGEVIFGDNASSYSANDNKYLPSNFSANGKFDEVRIYNVVLPEIEIQKDMNESFGCSEFDHFEIDTIDESGLTCQADNIIIKACADSACSILNYGSFNVELFVNGVSNRTLTVTGGSTSVNYDYKRAGTAELSLDQSYQCKNSTSTKGTCDVTFKDSGFIFGNDDNDILAIPTQLSGKPSDIGFKEKKIFLQAVATNETTGSCDGVFPDGGDIPVELSYSCIAGSDCTNDVLINNGTSKVAIKSDSSPAVDVTLSFTKDSKAYFRTSYPDAGKLALNARKSIEVEDNNGNKSTKLFTGKSNEYVVRPFAFTLYFDPLKERNAANAIAEDASRNADPNSYPFFKKAGEEFVLTATAVQWKDSNPSQDGDKNGIPDDFTVISGNNIAEHFDNQKIRVERNLILPNDADKSPGLLKAKTDNLFVNSTIDNIYTFSEVGIIGLNALLTGGNYLDACLNGGTTECLEGSIQGNISNVGRFTPDHFELSLDEEGSFASVCEGVNLDMPFVYSGQMSSGVSTKGALQYFAQPKLLITAKSSICPNNICSTTQNYRGDFMKLTVDDIKRQQVKIDDLFIDLPIEDAKQDGVDKTIKVRLTASYEKGSLIEQGAPKFGALIFSYSKDDHFVYKHEANSEIAPFIADINLSIASIIDTDLIAANDADDELGASPAIVTPETVFTFHPTGKEVRFGRAVLDNSFGPETSNLPQPLHLQFLSTTGNYVASNDDTCTQWNSNNITLTDITLDNSKTSALDGTGFFHDGSTQDISLKAPEGGNDLQGKLCVEYNTPSWLRYAWVADVKKQCAYDNSDVDDLLNDNPSAIATFGAFRGNDRIIYRRETAH